MSETTALTRESRAFPEGLPLADPAFANAQPVADDIAKILGSGLLTNGPYVRELEARAAGYLGVRNCVAVSSCTSGLMLLFRASGLTGDVVVPSFTFSATAHAVQWSGLRPVFCDIEPTTLTLSPEAARHAIGVRTCAILATHLYGTPCATDALARVAADNGIKLFFDAAHAFGSTHDGKHVGGFGDAEVFSLSPTKLLVAAEGGIIATDNDVLAERLRIGRDYGNPGNYDCTFVGLNARMSELHAATALASFEDLEERIERRNHLADAYRRALAPIGGITFPTVPENDRSTYKDFTILIDAEEFGADAAALALELTEEGVDNRRYYSPPVHRQKAYKSLAGLNGRLEVTDDAARRVLTLPLWPRMTEEHIERVARAIETSKRTPLRPAEPAGG